MRKILSLLLFIAIAISTTAQNKPSVTLNGAFKDGSLVFTFKNTTGKTIANCDFKLVLPECAELLPKGKKYQFQEGDATEGMTFSIQANSTKTKYSVAVYDGEFDETQGHTIIYVPVRLKEGYSKFDGNVVVSEINFGDSDGNNISSPANFTIDITTEPVITGDVQMNGEVKDNKLVFTYANTTGKAIANCSFQLTLPSGMSLVPNGSTYQYEKGNATSGMTFSITSSGSRYTVTLKGGTFNESAGSTIVTLPLQGNTGGKATVSSIAFSTSDGISLGKPNGFTMDIPSTAPVGSIDLYGAFKDGSLVFTFKNTTGKTIANCDFKLVLPECAELLPKGKKYQFQEGDATEGMTFSIQANSEKTKYSVAVYDGEFDETQGHTIIYVPVRLKEGYSKFDGNVVVSEINFGDSDGNNIYSPANFTIDITTEPVITGDVQMNGEVKDNKLVFTYANTTGKAIANCSFQLTLPSGMSLVPNGSTYQYEKGNATSGMTFSITSSGSRYTVTLKGGTFNESAGSTIVTLPLQGNTGGKATVSSIAFSASDGSSLGKPNGFTMDIPSTAPVGSIDLYGAFKDGSLVFTFKNTTGKTIANCDFKLVLPECAELLPKGKKYQFQEGDATEGMTFSIQANSEKTKYSVAVYDGEFDETQGHTIIYVPVRLKEGYSKFDGNVVVSEINFGDSDGNNIYSPANFTIDMTTEPVITGDVQMNGEVKDNKLVFTYANTTGKAIANCSFQLTLPSGMSLVSNGSTYQYEKGNATSGMTFSITSSGSRYTVTLKGGTFNESAGSTIVTLPLQGNTGGKATVSSIAFSTSDGISLGKPNGFTMDIPSTAPVGSVELKGEVEDGNMVFTFENTTGKTIANCNFQLTLPEGVSIKKNSTGKKYLYEKGNATEDMENFSIQYSEKTGKYTIAIYNGEFDEEAGNTIISLPLEGNTQGGKATVSNIAFGDPDGNNIYSPADFIVNVPAMGGGEDPGSVELKGEVKNGNLVFTFENTTGKAISICSFQLTLPDDMSLISSGNRYLFEKGDATDGMTFSIALNGNKYIITANGGEFNETAGNTIITLPLQGKSGGKATVGGIMFANSIGNIISRSEELIINIPPINNGEDDSIISLKGAVKDGNLVFTFENNSGKTIANCNFQITLPEGVSIKKNSTGKKYLYEKGDATEDMTFSVAFSEKTGKYTIAVYDGEFDEEAGNTIISLPLQGTLSGDALVSNIDFGDPDGNNIYSPEAFNIDLTSEPVIITGSVELKGEVKDGSLVFTFENTTGKTIGNCSFQFELPEGMSLIPKGTKYEYDRGDATKGMSFSITSNDNRYTVTIFGSEFNENAGNTIISLPLQGKSGGRTVVSNIIFATSEGNILSRPDGFSMDIPAAIENGIELKGEVKDGSLVFTFENPTGKAIGNCNFQFELPEDVSVKHDLISQKCRFEEGDATKGLIFYIASNDNKYTVIVYGGEFNENAGNTIISLPLEGKTGGKAIVSNIAFANSEGVVISSPEGFTTDITSVSPEEETGSVELKSEVKDGNLVFTFENTTGKTIANCSFQLELPEDVSVLLNSTDNTYIYEVGDATAGMTFSVTFKNNKYNVAIYGGEFNETEGNTIISLPLEGKTGGKAIVSNIAFSDSKANVISRPDGFTTEITSVHETGSVELKSEVKDGSLVFAFENTTSKTIANCSFQFELPEGSSVMLNSTGKKFMYEKGDATEAMTFSVAFKDNKYSVTIYGGEFNESAGNTIISLPLEGKKGIATVSNIMFVNSEGRIISCPENFNIEVPTISRGRVDLKGEVKDGDLVFTFENTTGKTIANCNFQFTLPESMSVMLNSTGKKFMYEKGDATEDMTFSVAFKNDKYTVVVYDGKFNEEAGNTIISLPLQGKFGGKANVSNIAFGDPNGNNISQPENLSIDIPGNVELKGEVKDGNLVFSFENTTGKAITNCNFQFTLPEGVTLNSNGETYQYAEGDATAGLAFIVAFSDNQYSVRVYAGEFKESAGNTIISLPLQGKAGGKATVSNIIFNGSNGNIISKPRDFTINVPTINTGSVELKGEVKEDDLVFTFDNKTGKTIGTCSFEFELPEDISLIPIGNYFDYDEGDATAGMKFSVALKGNKYVVTVSGGKFNEKAGNTIISLPLQGKTGGKAIVSSIAFSDPDGYNITSQSNDFTMDIPNLISGEINMKSEVKNGSLVFTYENTTGKTIANCNFQFELPEGITLIPNGNSYLYDEGDATESMTFSIAFKNNKYSITVYGGEFNETAGHTIISLPLQGKAGGKATVSSIAFGGSNGTNISTPEDFTIELPVATYGVDMKGEVKDRNLVFTFENNTGRTIGTCNFQFELPEGVSIKKSGKKYMYEASDATAGMTFYVTCNNNKYTVAAFGGEFNEAAGNTIISLALQGRSGGNATISNIAFGDSKGNNISRAEDFTIDIPSTVIGGIDLKGEVKEGSLVFTYENKSGNTIANCNFQFTLPEGVAVKRNAISGKYKYEEGDATEGMTFYIANNGYKYTVAVFGGEFDEASGNTVISLPLEGVMAGEVSVSNIDFGDPDGYSISSPEGFSMAITGVGLQAKVIDGSLVFTYDNNSGKSIGTCVFQFELPEGVFLTTSSSAYTREERNAIRARRIAPAPNTFEYEAGDATNGMTFDISFDEKTNKYTVAVSGGEFNETAGNTLVSLPLDGKSGGEAVINDIAFGDSDGETISTSEEVVIDVVGIEMKGEVKDGNLVFTFVDHDSKAIGSCNFQFELPEGLTLIPNGNKYVFEKGDATENMSFTVSLNDNKYNVTIYDGLFNKTEGTIISLPLQGKSGGETTVNAITFGDSEGYISSLEDLTMDIPSTSYGIDMKAEMKDGNMVLTFDNYSGKAIGKCNFQLVLPEGVSVKKNSTGKKYLFEKGDATEDMTFSIAFSNNVYIVAVSDGEFNETAGHTIITLPLQGRSGGNATVSDIIFGGADGNNISHPENLTLEVTGLGVKGDVDGNGSIGLGDIEAILRIMAGGESTRAADVDDNGSVGLGDIENILRIMAGGQ